MVQSRRGWSDFGGHRDEEGGGGGSVDAESVRLSPRLPVCPVAPREAHAVTYRPRPGMPALSRFSSPASKPCIGASWPQTGHREILCAAEWASTSSLGLHGSAER